MSIEVKVPTLGESVTEATIGQWLKRPGEAVTLDEPIASLETDKVAIDVNAPAAGVMGELLFKEGDNVSVGSLLTTIEDGVVVAGAQPPAPRTEPAPAVPPAASAAAAPAPVEAGEPVALSPAVRRAVLEYGIDPATVRGTGKDGRLTKEDVIAAASQKQATAKAASPAEAVSAPAPAPLAAAPAGERREERVKMTRLRQTIARRLKEAQETAALLTTFNDVDMSAVMAARDRFKDAFEKKHGVKLGFMGFFVKACVQALKEIPAVNGEIDGADIVYKNYYHVGVAVGTDKGLVVPVVRDCDHKSIAEIEKAIADVGRRARDGQLKIDELQGGTFTITNGGIYGSLMSTPILNAPQSAILGMHKIQDRPVAITGKVEIRPMMYLALSYDHRVIDGKEAVTFLVRVKESLEDPARLVLDL